MKPDRRDFLKLIGASSLLTLAPAFAVSGQSGRGTRVAIFWEDNFPMIDGLDLTRERLGAAFRGIELVFAGVDALTAERLSGVDLLVNSFGSAFPQSAWPTILKYLQGGGNLLNLGGVPFSVPVLRSDSEFSTGPRQVNYHKRLGIIQSYTLGQVAMTYRTNVDALKNIAGELKPVKTFALYPRFTGAVEFPDESGSDGPREAVAEALIGGFDETDRMVSAPIVIYDRLKAEFAGGRWVLVNYEGTISDEMLTALVKVSTAKPLQLQAQIAKACYRGNETPAISISMHSPASDSGISANGFRIEVVNSDNDNVISKGVKAKRNSDRTYKFEVSLSDVSFANAFYRVNVTAFLDDQKTAVAETGFWVDDALGTANGKGFTADRHFLYRDSEPFPVVGTTYMASDVHRRFLVEPNPAVWDADLRLMKGDGVNMIRTGIWTGWKLLADENGQPTENALRAFEAFMLSARRHDIPVIFTFFAFVPEMFGGKNAYLDPRSIAGQKRFMTAFAARVKTAKDVIWDLINEPSFANPKALWSCRPNGDEFEKAAWIAWLKTRFGETNTERLGDILRQKWRLTAAEDPFTLPADADFDGVNIISDRRPFKAAAFRMFAQNVFAEWALEMNRTLKKAGDPSQLVTVGQDEAGTGDSPGTQFHSGSVDLTGLHNWWSNDDLVWDNVISKAPAKPNLIGETGLMSYERADGSAWRSEAENAALLERKMALALGASGCGSIEWVWNTNPYMNIDNEAGIGFLRVDGSAKPELQNFARIAKFASDNRRHFRRKTDEKSLMVIPHSYQFMPRSYAGEATKRAVRAFHYHCRNTMRSVSEYNIAAVDDVPKLIILPSPRILSERSWQAILELVRQGSTLAVTGYFEADEHFLPVKRMGQYFPVSGPVPVAQNEFATIDGREYRVRFNGDKLERVERAELSQRDVLNARIGLGEILWCPVPLEIGEFIEPVAALYYYALGRAGLAASFRLKTDDPSILVVPTDFENAVLYTIVSESGRAEPVHLTHLATTTAVEFTLPAGLTNLIFIDKRSGAVISRMI